MSPESQPQYSADSPQIIPLEVTRNRKRYPTLHHLRGCPDEVFVEYDKLLNVRVRVGRDKSVETLTEREKAARYVYATLLEKVVGWGAEDGSNVDDKIVRMVVEEGLFICAAEAVAGDDGGDDAAPLGDADADKPWEQQAAGEGEAVRLRFRFNGAEVVTLHYPSAAPSADQQKRFERLNAKKKFRPGGSLSTSTVSLESTVKPLGKLYDELFGRAEGYADNRVPLWHKAEVVSAYLDQDEASVQGN